MTKQKIGIDIEIPQLQHDGYHTEESPDFDERESLCTIKQMLKDALNNAFDPNVRHLNTANLRHKFKQIATGVLSAAEQRGLIFPAAKASDIIVKQNVDNPADIIILEVPDELKKEIDN